MASTTFLWHDYETFGANPKRDRPAQFAAIRTDSALNEIGEPLMLYCQPSPDFLPDPQACLITGITPQECWEKGVPEHQFAAQIESAFAQAGTIGVGYNSIRFDDEVTRHLLWRNLIDPYAREWRNGCGRWDLLDVVRTAYALRPAGIEWPQTPEGRPSFRLEHLSAANGLLHESAHDALSDVRATIALARLLRSAQPRLFEFCLALHKKERVAQELGLPLLQPQARPFLHVSGMFSTEQGCLAVMWPLASHPSNRNEILAWNLAFDPSELARINSDELRLRLFSKADDLPEGMTRLPIKSIHLNRSPTVISNLKTLSSEQAERWKIDFDQVQKHAEIARDLPDMSALWASAFLREKTEVAVNVDEDLYGGFVGDNDRQKLESLRQLTAENWATVKTNFEDGRLGELVFRYQARNFPQTLNPEQQQRWEQHRNACLLEGAYGARTIEALFAQIDDLHETADERGEEILAALYDYAEALAP